MKLTKEAFVEAFVSEWQFSIRSGQVPPSGPYGDREVWKNFIEGPSGILAKVLAQTEKHGEAHFAREPLFRFDVGFVVDSDKRRPVAFSALIEHELNNDPETEMQKLITARAPLKVLIFYDWADFEKTTPVRKSWAEDKLNWFQGALEKANALCQESKKTSYVMLLGRRAGSESMVEWWQATATAGRLGPLKPVDTEIRGTVITDLAEIKALNGKLANILEERFPNINKGIQIAAKGRSGLWDGRVSGNRRSAVSGWIGATSKDGTRHLNLFLKLEDEEKNLYSMVVQLNFPASAKSSGSKGVFVKDSTGRILVAHRGGLTRVTALKRADVMKEFSSQVISVTENGKPQKVILIAGIDEPDFVAKIIDFAARARDIANRLHEARTHEEAVAALVKTKIRRKQNF